MSNFFNKATHKVKKKVGRVVDRLRSSPQESRAASPETSQQNGQSTSPAPGVVSSTSPPTIASAVAQSSIGSISAAIPSPEVASSAATGTSSPSLEPAPPVVPAYARPPSAPTVLATTGSAVKGLLVAARDGSDLFLPLKAALVGVVALWDVFDRTVEAKAEFTKLESKLIAFKAIAEAHEDEPRKVDLKLQTRLASIAQAVQGLWEAVEKRQARGGFARVMQSSIDLGDIKNLVDAISSLLEFESSVTVEKRLGLIVERLEDDKNERLKKERAEKQEKVINTIKSVLGDNMVSEAGDYEQPSYAGCMVGTRDGVLSKFIAWVKNDPMLIFWLARMAGTGKTSIAVSLCRMLRTDPAVFLAGGYFCSRSAGSIARTDVRRILPTLAGILAGQSQEFAEALAAELENDRNVGHKPVAEQIGPLLRRPLVTLASSSRPIVFVVDALDECSDERELADLLRLVADFECETKVKFILTSRPELHIRGTPISNPSHNTILQLHTISVKEVTSDIRLYISGTLNGAAPNATWYTDHDIDRLVKLSGGLFIFASTVLKYVLRSDEDEDRQDRLRKVTSVITTRTGATSSIDKIYELVLIDASKSDNVDEDELERMKRILACILTARVSLSVEALAALINVTPGRLRGSLGRLHSLVYLPAGDGVPGLRTLHASFGDYLFEHAPQHIRIPATLGHDFLASGCLRRLARDDLCFNISRSRSSFEPNSKTAPDRIPLSLIYACLHWAHHIDAASTSSAFDAEIGMVFRTKFLFWLEVLSVLCKVGIASGLLRIAGSAVKLSAVSQFLRDANAFVAASHAAISGSAAHIYISALPFAAKDSLVYREFAPLCTGIVSVATVGIDRHGGRLVASLSGHEDKVNSIAYSPDGRLLASGSIDGTVRIWDTRTGEEAIAPLRGNDGIVLSVSFSPDGKRVASCGEGKTVHVWSIETGREALPALRGHSQWIQSVAFSCDGTLIASGSDDKTVRLWSAETGREISAIESHTDEVNAVAFSPDGRLLASGSSDKTVCLWNLRTGQVAGDPLTSLNDVVSKVAFSPDGRWLAAGSLNTHEIRIWDVETRQPTAVAINNQFGVVSLVYSPDSSMLLSNGHTSIRFWDPRTGRELVGSSLVGHSDWVYSIAFSPDGLFLASGSGDRTLRIWYSVGGRDSDVLQAHSGPVIPVAVSGEGTFIVSGSSDHSVRIWDASTGESKLQPLLGHTGFVLGVAISSDGRLIASASADRTVRLWNAQTGRLTGETLKDHKGEVNAVAFSLDTRWLASGSDDKTVRVWDLTTRRVAPFSPLRCMEIVTAVSFSPDGRLLAAGDLGGYVHIWRSGTDQQAREPLQANSQGIYAICFSPDASKIVSGGDEYIVRIWDIDGGHQVHTLIGHSDLVRSIAYSPDGRCLVSASDDKTLRIWNPETCTAVATLCGHSNRVMSVTFTPNGRSFVSGGGTTIRIWDLESALSLASQAESDPLARLGCATIDSEGWIVGPSGELLLWVPADYRSHVRLPPCSMIIASHRVVLTFDEGVYWGDDWTACWRGDTQPALRPS